MTCSHLPMKSFVRSALLIAAVGAALSPGVSAAGLDVHEGERPAIAWARFDQGSETFQDVPYYCLGRVELPVTCDMAVAAWDQTAVRCL